MANELERAKRIISTPEFKLAFQLHTILAHCYEGQKEARLQAYRDAGIHELLAAAEKKAKRRKP